MMIKLRTSVTNYRLLTLVGMCVGHPSAACTTTDPRALRFPDGGQRTPALPARRRGHPASAGTRPALAGAAASPAGTRAGWSASPGELGVRDDVAAGGRAARSGHPHLGGLP